MVTLTIVKTFMDLGNNILWIIVLLLVTALTLNNSHHHHKIIALHYGPSARLFDPLIAITSFLVGALVTLMFQLGINVLNFERVSKLLPKNEKIVMDALFNNKTMTELDLSVQTGLSKRRISQILSKMEKKGVITRTTENDSTTINSSIYKLHKSANIISDLPGLTEKRVLIMIFLVLLFGLSFSILNNYHNSYLEHPLRPVMYLLAIEFWALGG
ncbi:MAG: helix-turn-helix domain-containing protein, partial [Candidatus Altiarchaeota archaeon]